MYSENFMDATSAGYMPVCTIISFSLCNHLFNKLQFYIRIKFFLGMDNSSYTILTIKELLLVLKLSAISGVLAAMFNNCIIKTLPSNADSCEE